MVGLRGDERRLGLRLEVDRGAGDEAEQDHHHAHDHHDAAGAVGADELRPVEHLGLVLHAEKLGGVGDRDGLGVAAEPAQAGARAFEDGANLGDGAVPPRQAAQTRTHEPAGEGDGDGGEDETYQHVIDSLRFEFAPANSVRSPPPCGEGLGVGVLQRITARPPPRRFAPTLPTRGRVGPSTRLALIPVGRALYVVAACAFEAPAHFARMAARLRTMPAVAMSTTATPRPTSDQAASDGKSTACGSGCAITALAVSLPPPAAPVATAPARATRSRLVAASLTSAGGAASRWTSRAATAGSSAASSLMSATQPACSSQWLGS